MAVLIIVISVMSGFDQQLREKILGFNPHLRVEKRSGTMKEFGSDGAHLALGLPKGTLVIEVQKEGYESYKEVVAVRADESEHFVSVTLPPKNKGK